MENTGVPAPKILKDFGIDNPVLVERTALATIWKVVCSDGQAAALKLYHQGDMRNEAPGLDMLEVWDGDCAARLIQRSRHAALIEWLDGPSLGDLTRQGEDRLACHKLAEVANCLHAKSRVPESGLPSLADWFQSLFELSIARNCPAPARRDLAKCQAVAKRLLASQEAVVPLHGDLHHDNVRRGARGWCAFDAKGVLGERAYELANAFRNPKRAEQTIRDPARVSYLADSLSEALGVDRQRLLDWAAVKCALSIAWRAKGRLEEDPELDLLSLLVTVADQCR